MTSSRRDQLARGGASAAAGALVARVAHAIAYLVLARLLAPEDFAELALAAVVINAFALLPGFGLGTALLASARDPKPLARSALTAALLGGVLLCLVTWAATPLWVQWFDPSVAWLIGVLALSLACRAPASVASAMLDRAFRFRARAACEAAGGVTFLAVSMGLAAAGLGATSVAWGWVASSLVVALSQMHLARLKPTRHPQWRALRGTSVLGSVVLVTSLLQWVFLSAEPLLVERWFGKGVLGTYCLASYLMLLPAGMLGFLASRLALPALVDARDRDTPSGVAFTTALGTTSLLWASAVIPMVVASGDVVRWLYGAERLDVGAWLPLFVLMSWARILGSFGGPALLAHGRASVACWLVVGQTLVAWPLAAWLAPTASAAVVAWCFGGSAFVAGVISLEIGGRALGVPRRRWLAAGIGAPLAVGLVAWSVSQLSWPLARWCGVLLSWSLAGWWVRAHLVAWCRPVLESCGEILRRIFRGRRMSRTNRLEAEAGRSR